MEDPEDDNVLQKPKEKKPRTAKQVEAFEKAKQKRVEVLKIKREKIQEIKASKPEIPIKTTPVPEPMKPAKTQIIEPKEEEEEDEEPQVIIVKKRPKKKKPIVIYEEDEEEDEEPPVPILVQTKLARHQTVVQPIAPAYKIKFV